MRRRVLARHLLPRQRKRRCRRNCGQAGALQDAQWTTRRPVPACCHRAPRCISQTAQPAAVDWWGSQHSPGHAAAPLNPSSLDTVRRPELAICIGARSKCLLRPAVPSATQIGPRLTGVRTEYGVRPRAR
eukprot:scaffold39266_cov93-Phaeocystis_antarctica.AAC.1